MITKSTNRWVEEKANELVFEFFSELEDDTLLEKDSSAEENIWKFNYGVLDLEDLDPLTEIEKDLVKAHFERQVQELIRRDWVSQVEQRLAIVVKRSMDELEGIVSDLEIELDEEDQDYISTMSAIRDAMKNLADCGIEKKRVDMSRFYQLVEQMMDRALHHEDASPQTLVDLHEIISNDTGDTLLRALARMIRDLPILPLWIDLSPEGWNKVFGNIYTGLAVAALVDRLEYLGSNDYLIDLYRSDVESKMRGLFPDMPSWGFEWYTVKNTVRQLSRTAPYMPLACACQVIDQVLLDALDQEDPKTPDLFPNPFERILETT